MRVDTLKRGLNESIRRLDGRQRFQRREPLPGIFQRRLANPAAVAMPLDVGGIGGIQHVMEIVIDESDDMVVMIEHGQASISFPRRAWERGSGADCQMVWWQSDTYASQWLS